MKEIFDHARDELNSKPLSEYGEYDAQSDSVPVQKMHAFIKNTYDESQRKETSTVQFLVDYLSLMTDRFALRMFKHLVIPEPIK